MPWCAARVVGIAASSLFTRALQPGGPCLFLLVSGDPSRFVGVDVKKKRSMDGDGQTSCVQGGGDSMATFGRAWAVYLPLFIYFSYREA